MPRLISALFALAVVGACAGSDTTAPAHPSMRVAPERDDARPVIGQLAPAALLEPQSARMPRGRFGSPVRADRRSPIHLGSLCGVECRS